MTKFLVLYKASPEEFRQKAMAMSSEEQQKVQQEWFAWMGKHQSDIVVAGPAGKTKEVSATGVKDAHNDIIAYGIVQAETHDNAAKIFSDSPHLKVEGGTIEVIQILDVS